MRFEFRATALGLLLAVLAGCGSDTVTPPPPVATPTPPPVTTVVSEGSRSGLGQRILIAVPFQTTGFGTIRATVDWTFAESTIYVYMSAGSCTIDEINGGTCRFVAVSQVQAPKPRVVTVTGQPAGSYTLYIGNFQGEEESVSWQVLQTSSASSAAAAPVSVAPSVPWR